MKLRHPPTRSILGFASVIFAMTWCRSATFEVVGETASATYRDGAVIYSRTNAFRVSADDCKFLIHTDAPGEGIEFSEFGVETNYSFHLFKHVDHLLTNAYRLNDGVITEVPLKKPGKSVNDSTLDLNPTPVPRFSTDITPVWLAYVSHCYLAGRPDGMIQPPVPQDSQSFQEQQWHWAPAPARWRFSISVPRPLESLVIYRDGQVLLLPQPYQGRTTNLVYEALSWTNTAGLTLPREFRISRYAPDFEAKDRPRLILEGVIHGWTRQITNRVSISRFGPTITPRTRILDHRWETEIGSRNGIVYMATEGRILGLEELRGRRK